MLKPTLKGRSHAPMRLQTCAVWNLHVCIQSGGRVQTAQWESAIRRGHGSGTAAARQRHGQGAILNGSLHLLCSRAGLSDRPGLPLDCQGEGQWHKQREALHNPSHTVLSRAGTHTNFKKQQMQKIKIPFGLQVKVSPCRLPRTSCPVSLAERKSVLSALTQSAQNQCSTPMPLMVPNVSTWSSRSARGKRNEESKTSL